jgi:hypothetical protein
VSINRFFDRRFTRLSRLRAGCDDPATADSSPRWDVLPEVARSYLADGYPELSRHLTRHLD